MTGVLDDHLVTGVLVSYCVTTLRCVVCCGKVSFVLVDDCGGKTNSDSCDIHVAATLRLIMR